MSIHYEHTQRGTLMIVTSLIGALVCTAMAYGNAGPTRWLPAAMALGLLIMAWLFSSLTVIVNDNEVSWYFGPGAWTYRLARGDIAAVNIVRNKWTNGFGIRLRSDFRLYNVSGLDAVEIKLKDGEIRRIGTDDPAGLAAALQRN